MSVFRRIWLWLKWPAAIALMGGLIWLNWDGLCRVAGRPIQWPYLLSAVGLLLACTLLTFFRWYLLVWAQEFDFSFREAVRLGFVGQISSYVGPGIVGGDLVKAVIVARGQTSRRTVAAATVLLDRVLGLLSLVVLGAVMTLFGAGLPAGPRATTIVIALWASALCGLAGIGVMLIPGITRLGVVQAMPRLPVVGRAVGDLINGVALYQSRPRVLIACVGMGVVSHALLIVSFYCGGRAVEPWVADLSQHFLFMPIAETFATLVPTPGGLGGLEGAVQYFYESVAQGAVPAPQARNAGFIAALMFRLIQLGLACLGNAWFLVRNTAPIGPVGEAPDPLLPT